MPYDTQTQADRLAIRQGLWLAQQPFAGHASYGSGSFKKRRFLLGNDSLTDGAGSPTSNYRSFLKALLDPKYGDPGIPAGWVDDTAGGLVAFSQTGASGIASLAWNDASRIKAPFGGGRYVLNATANSLNFFVATKDTDIIAVSMWVEFTAAGQSFNIKQASAPGATTLITISGDNYPLNTPVKITFPLNATYDSGLTVSTINTNGANYIYFWWREFHYATPRAGVELVNVGIGGTKIAD